MTMQQGPGCRLQLLKRRPGLLHARQQGRLDVAGLERSRVPYGGVSEVCVWGVGVSESAAGVEETGGVFGKGGRTLGDGMVASVLEQLLGALHGHGALGGDEGGGLEGGSDGGGLGRQHAADKTDGLGLGGQELAGGQADVADPRGGRDDLGQAGERADVGGEPDVDLLDAEAGVLGAEADVGTAGNVDGEAKGDAVDGADDGWGGCQAGQDKDRNRLGDGGDGRWAI